MDLRNQLESQSTDTTMLYGAAPYIKYESLEHKPTTEDNPPQLFQKTEIFKNKINNNIGFSFFNNYIDEEKSNNNEENNKNEENKEKIEDFLSISPYAPIDVNKNSMFHFL